MFYEAARSAHAWSCTSVVLFGRLEIGPRAFEHDIFPIKRHVFGLASVGGAERYTFRLLRIKREQHGSKTPAKQLRS